RQHFFFGLRLETFFALTLPMASKPTLSRMWDPRCTWVPVGCSWPRCPVSSILHLFVQGARRERQEPEAPDIGAPSPPSTQQQEEHACRLHAIFATSPSWPTSTTVKRRWSTPCCANPAPSPNGPSWSTGSWTPAIWNARRASPF